MGYGALHNRLISYGLPALLAALAVAGGPHYALAQDSETAQPTPQTYWLRVVGDPVNVRSRPDLNSLVVTRVPRDTVLEAVALENGWHKIVPPAGTFMYVSSLYVQRTGPTEGVVDVTVGTLIVRAGSTVREIEPLKSERLANLADETRVEIIGRQGEWYKIVPPPDVYFYISDDYVDRISAEQAEELRRSPPPKPEPMAPLPAPEPQRTREPQREAQPAQQPEAEEPGPEEGQMQEPEPQPAAPESMDSLQPSPAEPQAETAGPDEESLEMTRVTDESREPAESAQPAADVTTPAEPAREPQPAEPTAQPTEAAVDEAAAAREVDRAEPGPEARAPAGPPVHPRQERQAPKTPQKLVTVRGVLRPSFALAAGPYGLRYRLEQPITRRVMAYVEFDPLKGIDVSKMIGRYVGVTGARYRDEKTGVPVIRAERVTHLTASRKREP